MSNQMGKKLQKKTIKNFINLPTMTENKILQKNSNVTLCSSLEIFVKC